jgi:3alpha(or 20beta)-hydroxysteroid dehydrogenase
LLFTQAGARVALADARESELARTVADVRAAGGEAASITADLSHPEACAAVVTETVRAFGRVDVLLNNAGVGTMVVGGTVETITLEHWDLAQDVNVRAMYLLARAAVPHMRTAGGGSIVNISSTEGITGAAGLSAYSASKFAIRGMTKAAAQELGQYGIRVNSVHPGGVLTRMVMDQASSGMDGERFLSNLPLNRFAEPAEISHLVAYLASDESSYSTGAEFVADGGLLSGPGY